MKKLYLFIIGLLLIILPSNVFAANANVSVTSSDVVQVNNTITVKVKISSGSPLGSWQLDLSYDKNYLKLTSSSAEAGGTAMVGYVNNGNTKSKEYTFKFTALKSGSTKVGISSGIVYGYDEKSMNATLGSKNISIKTKEEIEATYSTNADLKSISVGEYTLSPAFSKDTLEYSVEVENEVETVNLTASKADGNASVSGTGEKTLLEGPNKFEIVVTAQKGNTKTYVVTINRKELDPIPVKVDNKEYTIVRRVDQLAENPLYVPKTVKYGDFEIPALYSDITGTTIIGLKDEDGNITMYILDKEEVKNKYIELKGESYSIYPLELKENEIFKSYIKQEVEISGEKVMAYFMDKDDKYAIIYAQNLETGEIYYYSYSTVDKTFQIYNKDIATRYDKLMKKYKYIMAGMLLLIVILIFIIIIRKPSKKVKNNNNKIYDYDKEKPIKEDIVKEEVIPYETKKKEDKKEDTEIKLVVEDEEKEEIQEQPKKKKKKKHHHDNNEEKVESVEEIKLPEDVIDEEIGVVEIEPEEVKEEPVEEKVEISSIIENHSMTRREMKKFMKEEKKRLKEEKRRQRDFDF